MNYSKNNSFREYRCKYCNKLFFKGALLRAVIEVKCRNCKNFNVIEGEDCALHLSDHKGQYNKNNNNNNLEK